MLKGAILSGKIIIIIIFSVFNIPLEIKRFDKTKTKYNLHIMKKTTSITFSVY